MPGTESITLTIQEKGATMRYFRQHRQLQLCALVVWLLLAALLIGGEPAAAQPAECPETAPIRIGNLCWKQCPDASDVRVETLGGQRPGNLCLSSTANKIAQEVCSSDDPRAPHGPKTCVRELIQQLSGMKQSERCQTQATDALILRQQISEMVMTASLQVDGFLAEVDSETAEARAVHDELAGRRDTAVQHSTLASAIGSAGGAAGSALALVGDTAATVGNYMGATGGAVGAVFGLVGYFQQRGPTGCFPDLRTAEEKAKDKGKEKKNQCSKLGKADSLDCSTWDDKKRGVQPLGTYSCGPGASADPKNSQRYGCSPRMLYGLLCHQQAEQAENEEELERKAGKDDKPWKAWWFHSKYDPAVQQYLFSETDRSAALIQTWGGKDKLSNALITGNTNPHKLKIDELTDRANKLADLRAVVARMNRDLGRLTDDLAVGLRCGGKLSMADSGGTVTSGGNE
jgi:hypothetical protein